MTTEHTPVAAGSFRGPRGRAIVGVATLAVVLAIVWIVVSVDRETTDDAQIDGRITPIAAKVSGTITAVTANDNEYAEAGTVLATIEPITYEIALRRAHAELAEAKARDTAARAGLPVSVEMTASGQDVAHAALAEANSGVAVAEQELDAAQARLQLAKANLRGTAAERERASRDLERMQELLSHDEISRQRYDQVLRDATSAVAEEEAATAAIAEAKARLAAAEGRLAQAQSRARNAAADLRAADTGPEQLEVERARVEAAAAQVEQAQAHVQEAEIDLANTTVRAPSDGIVSRRRIEVGQVVARGQPVMALVSRDELWVTANFKETQIERMRPGQRVTFSVDGLGGERFTGRIDSIAAATGAKFSLIPPDNATGNFVKVVQRIPVKIAIDPDQDPDRRLRPGMSVVATVELR